MHEHHRCTEFFGHCSHGRIKTQCRNVIDYRGSGFNRPTGNFSLHGINGNRDGQLIGKFFDDRNNPLDFFFGGHRIGKRSGGFSTDVKDIGPVGCQFLPLRHRGVMRQKFSAVGKRIRCDVDDAHNTGPAPELHVITGP